MRRRTRTSGGISSARFEEAEFDKQPWVAKQWTSVNVSLYFKLKPGADVARVNAELPRFEEKTVPNATFGGNEFPVHKFLQLSAMPLFDLHLHSIDSSNTQSRFGTVMTFAAVAVLILIIACINFMNLSTARASQRAREVALRKVVGAGRPALVMQFLGESTVFAALSLVFALGFVELALPVYNVFLDRALTLSFLGADTLVPWLLALVAFVGVVGGLYPALYLSRFRPAQVLKANRSSDARGSTWLRSTLVVVQFAISIALIICTAVVYGQYRYTQTKDLGFEKGGVVVVRGLGRRESRAQSDVLKNEIASLPGVLSVTRSSDVPGDSNENNSPAIRPGDTSTEPLVLGRYAVDWDFLETYGLTLKAGRFFDESRGNDNAETKPDDKDAKDRVVSIVINERAVQRLGYASAQAAVGQRFKFGGAAREMVDVEVIGVIKDFHYRTIRQEIRPTAYVRRASNFNELSVRVAPGSEGDIMGKIEGIWKRHVPDIPFRGEFLEETLKSLYAEEKAQAQMFGAFSILAVIIACMGPIRPRVVLGRASHEGDRDSQSLGASSWAIVRLLVWQFSKPVLLANLIAWPLAAYLMRRWLSTFEYRIGLEPVVFVVAGGVALLIAWATVGGHAFRVSRTPPSRALRYE